MASLESRSVKLRNLLITDAVVMFASSSSNASIGSEPSYSARIEEKHMLEVAGEAFIVRYPNDELLLGDLQGGLLPKDSIAKAEEFIKERGCVIFEPEIAVGAKGEMTGEIVQLKNSCLPELK